jgi:hypothetical protein
MGTGDSDRAQCGERNWDGEPCTRLAIPGLGVCRWHLENDGGAEQDRPSTPDAPSP